MGVFGMLCKGRKLFSSVFAITERRDMGLYEAPLSMSLLSFGRETMLANFYMCGIMLVLRSVFNMLVRNASILGARCLICQDLVSCYFYFILLPLGPELCGECYVPLNTLWMLLKQRYGI